jgi:hypothetical protein
MYFQLIGKGKKPLLTPISMSGTSLKKVNKFFEKSFSFDANLGMLSL